MIRKIQKESFANTQCKVEESTHQVMNEIVLDDDYDLNGFDNQNLEGDSSCKNLSWEYEPLEEVHESLEKEEAYEAIDLSSSIELTYVLVMDSCVPFQHATSSYILYELEPKKKFCINTILPSKFVLILHAQNFHIESRLRIFIIKTHT